MLPVDSPTVRALADSLLHSRNHRVLDALTAIAADLCTTLAAVAIAWILQRPGISSVIIGPSLAGHVESSLAAFLLDLPANAVRRLDDVSRSSGLAPLSGACLTVAAWSVGPS
jgi:aryl-alcohol dehydrogenase-like predicted oxidoreductase